MVLDASPGKPKNETDKRKSQRIKVDQNSAKYYVEIPLPVPKDAKIKKEIVDISNEGLSFLMPEEEGVFLVGTPLVDITVVKDNKRSYFPQARVAYSKRLYGEGINYKIGLQFVKDTHSSGLERSDTIGQTRYPRFRLPRYDIEQLGSVSKIITFKNKTGTYGSYEMINFSKYGLAFRMRGNEVEESAALRVGDVVHELKVIIGHKKVYEGRASIVDFREHDNALIVGVKLEDSWLEVDKILYLGKSENIKNDLKTFLRDLPVGDKIGGEFKQIVADMRYYLEAIQSKLKDAEIRLANVGSSQKHKIEKGMLQAMIGQFSSSMDHWFITLNKMTRNLTKEAHELHKRYFQKHLHHLLLQSPFVKRSVEKPLGYGGDHVTINMIYDNAYDGHTLLGKLLSKYTYSLDASRVVRLRKQCIKSIVLEKMKEFDRTKRTMEIFSVGCGSAREIEEIMKANDGSFHAEISLLDFDERPLYYAEKRLSQQNKNGITKLNFLNKSIRALVKEKRKDNYDLIYSLGLADYFSNTTCKMLVRSLFNKLKQNGTLIIGQYSTGNSSRCYMEFVGEWYLIYRDTDELSKWLDVIKEPYKSSFYPILKGTYNFLIVRK
ncbi:MAG: methyltransferase domain-containing protein [Desulfobacterales bacterium]|nr:methyltransferase domain-containing protein [Desulfobacterales bacterium]